MALRPDDLIITDALARRPRRTPDLRAEAAAARELSALMCDEPGRAIARFLELAIELCGAGSAGLSLIGNGPAGERRFDWDAVAGPLHGHTGGHSPIDFSPCGLCMASGHTILVDRPYRVFTYLDAAARPLLEGLIVPLYDTGGTELGTIWIVHHDAGRHFDAEDARVMEQLAIQLVLALKLRAESERAGTIARQVERLKAHNAELIDDGAFLRGILAASADCIKVLDLDARVVFMSEGGQRVMEVGDFESIRGCPWPDFWQGQGRIEVEAGIAAARAGSTWSFRGAAPTMAGTPRWWDVQVTPIFGADGRPEKLLAVSRDVTEGRLGQIALEEALGLNTLILNSSRDCVVVLDLEGHTRFVSPGGIASMEISDVEAIIGLSWLRVWKGDDNAAARAAVATAAAGGIGRFQGFCPTHRGTPKWWDVMISPLPGADGRIERLVSIGRDITDLNEIEQRLALSEATLRLAIDAAEIGTWDLDLTTDTLVWSDRTKQMFGIAPDVPCSMADFYSGLHPDDAMATADAFASALDPVRRATYDVEYRTIGRDDGVLRWVAAKGRGIFDEQGRCIRAVGTAIDISGRRQAEERQRLLTHELNHRMKNTLSMVQAIANQTMRGTVPILEARDAFNARLSALGKAQDILTSTSWSQAGLDEVIHGALGAHGGETARFRHAGPPVHLSAKCALAMSLALHELATNAAKYGALSNETGTVDIRWTVDASRFRFVWSETGGPPVATPASKGFGSRLIERSLASYFCGTAILSFAPGGLAFTLDAPLAALTGE
ncbi:PAS domain S-box-containing protein [Stella humosa]|uniref:histidine kinase n=1 Tax=Stella humosa TaxID=94 RepID=A0A3N1M334_9PROT|nr:PAS domain-containing protein [Stella humosa]ROQ01964.1 PAS domain S-box-containing protein [Stella humosa]BBK32353.1 hypothetical protein STHU_29870 [Stella humosa]